MPGNQLNWWCVSAVLFFYFIGFSSAAAQVSAKTDLFDPSAEKAIEALQLSPVNREPLNRWYRAREGYLPPESSTGLGKDIKRIEAALRTNPLLRDTQFSVIASDCDGYGALVDMSHIIQICQGSIMSSSSLEELTALACHEVSHVLLGHLSSEVFSASYDPRNMSYDLDSELLADYLGTDLCASIGVDVRQMYLTATKRSQAHRGALISNPGQRFDEEFSLGTRDSLLKLRSYLRTHYRDQNLNSPFPSPFISFDEEERSTFSENFDDFRSILIEIQETPMINSHTLAKNCDTLPDRLEELGARLKHNRPWFALVNAYAMVCFDAATAGDLMSDALEQPHAHFSMFANTAQKYLFAVDFVQYGQRDPAQLRNKAFEIFERGVSPTYFNGGESYLVLTVASAFSGGEQSQYDMLRKTALKHSSEYMRTFSEVPAYADRQTAEQAFSAHMEWIVSSNLYREYSEYDLPKEQILRMALLFGLDVLFDEGLSSYATADVQRQDPTLWPEGVFGAAETE